MTSCTCVSTQAIRPSPEIYFPSAQKWTCWDSNPGPLPCKGSDLPSDLQAQERLEIHSGSLVEDFVSVYRHLGGGFFMLRR